MYGTIVISSCIPNILTHAFHRDTVDSVGIIPRHLPFTTSNTLVRTFRHAVALDERRAKFKANLWNRPSAAEQKLGTPKASPSTSRKNTKQYSDSLRVRDRQRRERALLVKWDPEDELFLREMQRIHSESDPERQTDVEEVWFAVRSTFLDLHQGAYLTIKGMSLR